VPRAAKAKKPDANSIYVAWTSGTAEIDGVPHTVVSGERRRGSDVLVQAHSWMFVVDGTPADEMPSHWDQLVERHQAEHPPGPSVDVFLVAESRPLEREDVIVLTQSLSVGWGQGGSKGNATYDKGTVFGARSEIAAALPDDTYQAEPGVQFTKPKRRRR
jgi:hypothetical protein